MVGRLVRLSFTHNRRPAQEDIRKVLEKLESDGLGKIVKGKKAEGFIKNPKLSQQNVEKYMISVEEYDAAFNKTNNKLSKTQIDVFQKFKDELYP